MTIFLHNKELIATDVAPSCRIGLYWRITPHSSMVMSNKNVGARVIDFDYRGNIKVVILNHSKEKLCVNCGDHIPQFILTHYETQRIIRN